MKEVTATMSQRRLSRAGARLVCGVTLGSLALFVAACGGDGNDDPTTTASPTPRGSPTRTTAASSASPAISEAGMELDEFVIRPKQTRALPGTINFQLTNAGEVAHEFVVIKSDLPVADLPRLPDDAGVDESELDIEGRLEDPLEAGADGELSVDLEVGKYILICNLAPNGISHYLSGMYTAFDVRTDARTADPTPTP